jgi:integrase
MLLHPELHPGLPSAIVARSGGGKTATAQRARGEGTVYWDDTRSRWVGQVFVDGRRRKVSDPDRDRCAKKLGELIHNESSRHVDRRSSLRGLLDDWDAKSLSRRDLAPTTLELHRWAIRVWSDEVGSVKLSELNVGHIEDTLERLARRGCTREDGQPGKPLGRSSLNKMRATIRQALAWAERRRIISHNPAASAELPARIKEGGERRALDDDELRRLLDALDGHPWRAMFLLSARIGLRPGEAAGVCADAVDLDSDPPTVAVVRGVQNQGYRPVLVETLKTRGARRTLAIPADVADALRTLVKERPKGLLFSSPDGSPVWPSTARAVLADASEAARIDPPARPNWLRHTAATNMANAGVPPHQVADVLGHTTTAMVDRVYRHRPAVIRGADAY